MFLDRMLGLTLPIYLGSHWAGREEQLWRIEYS